MNADPHALHHHFDTQDFHYSCEFHEAENSRKNETIILIHGLLRTYRSMRRLGKRLAKQGYEVYLYGYASSRYSIEDHSLRFQNFLRYLASNNKLQAKFHVITHSLGGIIAREALCDLQANSKLNCHKLIMLAPPNQGSYLAKLALQSLPFLARWVKPLSQLSDAPGAYVHQVGIPTATIGVIAAKFDAKVPPHTTHLAAQADFACVATNHTFIINHRDTRIAILKFLEHGLFKKP